MRGIVGMATIFDAARTGSSGFSKLRFLVATRHLQRSGTLPAFFFSEWR